MASLPGFKYSFTPSLVMTILAIVAITLLNCLGVWQIKRAHEKEKIIATHTKNTYANKPTIWTPQNNSPEQYQMLKITGTQLKNILLLDNQHYNHQFGYDVIIPLLLDNGYVVLIDKGWIAAPSRDKSVLFNIIIKKATQITGKAYYPAQKSLVLGDILEKINANMTIIEAIDIAKISDFLHKPVYSFIIRENANPSEPYIRNWPIVSMPPARHYGYAVQWFALAILVFIIFIGLNLKKSCSDIKKN